MSDDKQPGVIEVEPPTAAPEVEQPEVQPVQGQAAQGESIAPALRGVDPEPTPVTQAALLPVQQVRVGGAPRHRVHIEGDAGAHSVVRVGRDQAAPPHVPLITLAVEVVEDIVLALIDKNHQRALELLAPHYAPAAELQPLAAEDEKR